MLDAASFQQVKTSHPAIAGLSDKVSEILRDELNPGEDIEASFSAQISGSSGALVVTAKRVIAVWVTKLLIFFKFPTVQEFHYEQVNDLDAQGPNVHVHASADPSQREDDYEEGNFVFADPNAAQDFVARVRARSPRLSA